MLRLDPLRDAEECNALLRLEEWIRPHRENRGAFADVIRRSDITGTERIVQIAAEGRKYGLWLLLSTQRPSKIHPNALSQCDNLGLMKMSSPRDLAQLGEYFGYAPPDLPNRARSPTRAVPTSACLSEHGRHR